MDLKKMTKEDWIKESKKYGFEIDFNKKPGFYIGDHELTFEEIFPELLDLKKNGKLNG